MSEHPRADLYLVPWVFKALSRHAPGQSLTIVDAGCGDGYVAAQLAAIGHTVKGFDMSEDDIARAKVQYPGIDFSVHSIYEKDLSQSVGRVDCVVAIEVLEHLYDPRGLFHFCRSVLKPGGLLLLTTPYHGYLKNLALSVVNGWDRHFTVAWDGGHIKFFSKRTLGAMTREGLLTPVCFDGIGRTPFLWKSMAVVARNSSPAALAEEE